MADLLSQLRQMLAIEQAARVISPILGTGAPDAGMPSAPIVAPAQADAMVLDLLAGASDDELAAAARAAGPAGSSQEAAWLADEAARRAGGDA